MSILSIDYEQTIRNLQEQFNKIFPFLKIEFFTEPHAAGQLNAKNKMVVATSRIGDVQKLPNAGNLEVNTDITVGKFEMILKDEYGLYVQVFRKSGNIWLETSATDHWTLKQQNEEGKSLQEYFKIKKEDTDEP